MMTASTAGVLYQKALANVLKHGNETKPRGMVTKEVLGAHLVLTAPNANVIVSRRRNLNYSFMAAEWVWMMSGSSRAEDILPFNNGLNIAADEGSIGFAGAYGPKLIEQLPYVVDTLRKDPDSRRAVLTIWRERPRESRDVPCTVMLQYVLRGVCLHAFTYMRSNDLWLGFPYDIFNFTQIQKFVAMQLGASLGDYHHFVGSLHLYERNLQAAETVVVQPITTHSTNERLPRAGYGEAIATLLDLAYAPTRETIAPVIAAKWSSQLGWESDWVAVIELMAKRFFPQMPMSDRLWDKAVTEGGHV